MKDQKTLDETKQEKWERGKTLMLESLHKPDDRLRGCAHNQECYHELMEIRDEVIEIVRAMKNPHTPPLEFGKKNNHVEPTIETPNGDISETLMSGALGAYYMSEKREY
tara:strand:- start:148 stop:474 length:327 start_codon:yes stop_codon:yes gene_type:complete